MNADQIHYAVAMDAPRSTWPDVLLRVFVREDVRSDGGDAESLNYKLWVPDVETWTPDTVRMLLHELAAYLPAHDGATVTVQSKVTRSGGRRRKDGSEPTPKFSPDVWLAVSGGGWTATLYAHRNERTIGSDPRPVIDVGRWSEPMQAFLLDLAQRSPFALAHVRAVDCADPGTIGLQRPSRRDVVRGLLPNEALDKQPEESKRKRIKRLIDDILRGDL
jgi:hypothetical protein